MKDEIGLENSYTCECGAAIGQTMEGENALWVKKVFDFLEAHKDHGFTL